MLRERAGLTLGQLGEMSGTSPSYISQVETGTQDPSAAWLGKVAGALAASLQGAT